MKDPEYSCSTPNMDSAKTWFWTPHQSCCTSWPSSLPQPGTIKRRHKKRKRLSEDKKGANQERPQLKGHSTQKCNGGRNRRWKMNLYCREWSRKGIWKWTNWPWQVTTSNDNFNNENNEHQKYLRQQSENQTVKCCCQLYVWHYPILRICFKGYVTSATLILEKYQVHWDNWEATG